MKLKCTCAFGPGPSPLLLLLFLFPVVILCVHSAEQLNLTNSSIVGASTSINGSTFTQGRNQNIQGAGAEIMIGGSPRFLQIGEECSGDMQLDHASASRSRSANRGPEPALARSSSTTSRLEDQHEQGPGPKELQLLLRSSTSTESLSQFLEGFGYGSSASAPTASPPPSPTVCDPNARLECFKGRCHCKKGFTINHNGTKCLEIARNGLDSHCEEDVQCWKGLLGRMSECGKDVGRCRCYESENVPIVFHQGRCYYGEMLGDYCQIDGLCSATTSNATCTRSGLCQCISNFVPSWDKSRCLPIAMDGLNSSCEENIQCEKSQLGTLSECNQERMQCQCYHIPHIATIYYAGRCYFTAGLLGDVCQVHPQCDTKIQHSYCGTDGKCRCLEGEGYMATFNNSVCEKVLTSTNTPSFNSSSSTFDTKSIQIVAPGPGQDAVSDEMTMTSPSSSRSSTTTAARKASDGHCTEDSHCIRIYGSFGRCNLTKAKCECFIQVGTGNPSTTETTEMTTEVVKCLLAKQLGETCKYTRQCQAMNLASICSHYPINGGSSSSSGICECKEETYVPSSDGRKCLPIYTPGGGGTRTTCDEDLQCTRSQLGPLSFCNRKSGKCECTTLLPVIEYNGTCHFQRWIGSLCVADGECQASIQGGGHGHVGCIGGKCVCGDGYVQVEYNRCAVVNSTTTTSSPSNNSGPNKNANDEGEGRRPTELLYSVSSAVGKKSKVVPRNWSANFICINLFSSILVAKFL